MRFVVWKEQRWGRAASPRDARSLEDLRDLIRTEFPGRLIYLEAVAPMGERTLASKLRSSADDLTDEDFRWLSETVASETRGLRV